MGRKLNAAAAAASIGVHPDSIRDWAKKDLPHVRTRGGHIRIDADELKAYLQEQKQKKRGA